MKVRPRYKHWFPRLVGAEAITLYPYVFFNNTMEFERDHDIINHECVHVRQVRKLGWFKFYASYIWKWLTNGDWYIGVSYEQEAYALEAHLKMTPSELAEFEVKP